MIPSMVESGRLTLRQRRQRQRTLVDAPSPPVAYSADEFFKPEEMVLDHLRDAPLKLESEEAAQNEIESVAQPTTLRPELQASAIGHELEDEELCSLILPQRDDQLYEEPLPNGLDELKALFPSISGEVLSQLLLRVSADVATAVVNQVLEQPPMCRHLLEDRCYRSDCRFSHDLDTPCKFWLWGACKNEACLFKHQWPLGRLGPAPASSSHASVSHLIQARPNPRPQNAASYAAALSSSSLSYAPPVAKSEKVDPVAIPVDLWVENRNPTAFQIRDPMARFDFVAQSAARRRDDVIDLHFQSTRTVGVVLENLLEQRMAQHGRLWIATGTGHHVAERTHQRKGGYLLQVVQSWLDERGYVYKLGIDKKGHSGALLVLSGPNLNRDMS